MGGGGAGSCPHAGAQGQRGAGKARTCEGQNLAHLPPVWALTRPQGCGTSRAHQGRELGGQKAKLLTAAEQRHRGSKLTDRIPCTPPGSAQGRGGHTSWPITCLDRRRKPRRQRDPSVERARTTPASEGDGSHSCPQVKHSKIITLANVKRFEGETFH